MYFHALWTSSTVVPSLFSLFQECWIDPSTDAHSKRLQHVRSYFLSRVSSTGCLGPAAYTLESYLIVDNATVSDSGNYTFSVTTNTFPPRTVQEDINILIGKYSHSTVQ